MTQQNPLQLAQFNLGRRIGIATFMNAPLSEDLENVEVGIIGIPFDGGVPGIPGARHGPREIRTQSVRRVGGPYNAALKVSPFEKHKIYDCGDAVLTPFSIAEASDSITSVVATLLDKNILPICIGGDHFVTYPILKAIFQKHGPVGVVQFDSHTDTLDEFFGGKYMNATVFRRGIEEGFIIPDKLIQVGIRKLFAGDELDYHAEHNIRVISTIELEQMGVEGFRQELQILKDVKVYVTFDIDFVDPAFAPGTGGPEAGGVTSFETLQLVRSLRGLNIVGLDLVELCPPLDVGNITSLLAAQILYEMLCILP